MTATTERLICPADQLAARAADRIIAAAGRRHPRPRPVHPRAVRRLHAGEDLRAAGQPGAFDEARTGRASTCSSATTASCRTTTRGATARWRRAACSKRPSPTTTSSASRPTRPRRPRRRRNTPQTLATFFGLPADGPPPVFDLILLGLGTTATRRRCFRASRPSREEGLAGGQPAGRAAAAGRSRDVQFPAINAARAVLFLVGGAGKATVVKSVLEGGATPGHGPGRGRAADEAS